MWPDFVSRNPGVDPDKLTQTIVETTVPLKRPGTPEEMASALLFLVSPESSYVTGIILPVDGGGSAM